LYTFQKSENKKKKSTNPDQQPNKKHQTAFVCNKEPP